MFIDIREKEKKRGIRGLVSIPHEYAILKKIKQVVTLSSNSSLVEPNQHQLEYKNDSKMASEILKIEKWQENISRTIFGSNIKDNQHSESQVIFILNQPKVALFL
jgi:hypothetical protein